MKKILALLLTLFMIISIFPCTVFGENETVKNITVNVSISENGKFVNDKDGNTLANVSVSLTGQENYCINDVLKKAHETLNSNGLDSYAAINTQYGISITKLWNNESGNFSYWLNGSMPWGLETDVFDGDSIEAFIYKNTYPDTESYTKFENNTESVSVNESITFTLMQAGYDDNWNTVFSPCSDATITVDCVETDISTDAEGKATVEFSSEGTHIVSAVKNKMLGEETTTAIAAPVCIVRVTAPITVFFEAQKDGEFILMPQNIDVKSGLAQKYGYTELEKKDAPTFFDALVAAHILKYGDLFNIDTARSYLNISNHFITTAFGKSAAATSFFVNGDFPTDSGGTGYTVDEAILSSGDVLDYMFYQDTDFWSDYYTSFDCTKKDVKCNEKFELTLNGFMAMTAFGGAELLPIDGTDEDTLITLNTVNNDGSLGEAILDENGEPLTVDENGKVSLSFDEAGIYYITANGFAYGFPIMAPICEINVGGSENIATSAATPEITDPVGGTYLCGSDAAIPLSIKAVAKDNGTLTYQWYLKTNDGEYAKIDGATTQSFKPYSDTPCTQSYYCEVTNTFTSVSGETYIASANSAEIQVIFKTVSEYGANWTGTGSKEDPYLIGSQDDIVKLAEICNIQGETFKGKYFKLTNDIILPDEWISIGAIKPNATSEGNGANINPFSGSFDGDNHTVTILEKGLPLFGYVREATVSNFNIYGTKINGYGLIGKYTVDYGTDGSNKAETNPKFTVIIDNCKLKSGSSTLYSGFIGGKASGVNTVIIKNSTIEENVTIGYTKDKSNIGSFAGEFNGQIINCKSYANVYGIDFVGGICANKGQTIGKFEIYDCIFGGNIESTGKYVGGILGAGYGGTDFGFSASSPWPTVQNCLSTGEVKGANYVGGIMGAEPGTLECWESGVGYIQNNLFTGNISATDEDAFVGGTVGFIKSINRYTVISNNYFSENCGAVKGIGEIETVETLSSNDSLGSGLNKVTLNGEKYGREDDPKGADEEKLSKSVTTAELADGTTVRLLNSGLNSSSDWTISGNEIGFGGRKHILSISSAKLSAKSGVTQYVNGDDVLDEAELTLLYSDGTTEKIDGSQAVKQYTMSDKLADKSIAASIVYNNHQLVFMMNVKAGGTQSGAQGGSDTDNTISVKFTLYGDSVHDENIVHTLKANNLKIWIPTCTVTVPKDATIMDVLSKILNKNGYSWLNDDKKNSSTGNYIQSITNSDGVTLAEFTNGANSGWIYTLNGSHSLLGLKEQTLKEGDKIVFHYTDDYSAEQGSEKWPGGGTVSNTKKDETEKNVSVETTLKQEIPFGDITGHWAEDSIRYMVNNEIMNGVSDKLFAPDENLTRAMLVTILYRLENEPTAEAANFNDVEENSWYTDAVSWANANGIVYGTSSKEFSPDINITREQMATIIYRYAKYKKYDVSAHENTNILSYDDFDDVSKFAIASLQYTAGSGIMKGKTNTTLNPKDTATRAETATVITRMIEEIK